jgi:heme exporter protein D
MPDKMYFDSLQALLFMDGHGIYVWSTYLVVVVVLSGLLIQPFLRRRQLLQQLFVQQQRDQARRQPVKNSSLSAAESV